LLFLVHIAVVDCSAVSIVLWVVVNSGILVPIGEVEVNRAVFKEGVVIRAVGVGLRAGLRRTREGDRRRAVQCVQYTTSYQ
jgi:hypothetical protein